MRIVSFKQTFSNKRPFPLLNSRIMLFLEGLPVRLSLPYLTQVRTSSIGMGISKGTSSRSMAVLSTSFRYRIPTTSWSQDPVEKLPANRPPPPPARGFVFLIHNPRVSDQKPPETELTECSILWIQRESFQRSGLEEAAFPPQTQCWRRDPEKLLGNVIWGSRIPNPESRISKLDWDWRILNPES